MPNLYTDIYGPVEIVGVELDPQIIEVGRRYFDMTQPNLTAVAADGRRWLQDQPQDEVFDIVLVDAYRPPYIPFHLTTVEFFRLARAHMGERGVLAINVGRSATDFALVDALAATLAEVFPSVLVVDEPGAGGRSGQLFGRRHDPADCPASGCRQYRGSALFCGARVPPIRLTEFVPRARGRSTRGDARLDRRPRAGRAPGT